MNAALEERIAAAFADGAKSDDVAALIKEVEVAAVSWGEEAEQARARALEPTLSAADVAAARRHSEDAAFSRDRMTEAVRRLGHRLQEVRAQEQQARRRAVYDAALAERDTIAADIAAVYPVLSEKLADLAARIAANDAVIEGINRKRLPDRARPIASAELVARDLRGFVEGTALVPRITDLRLPSFRYSAQTPFVWPRC